MKNPGIVDITPLWEDILSVIGVTDRAVRIHLGAVIHTEKEDFPAVKVTLREMNRDYRKMTGEFYHLQFLLGAGDYFYRLLPFRENLEVSVKTTYMFENGHEDPDNPPFIIRYKGLFVPDKNPYPSSESMSNRTLEDTDKLAPVSVQLELQDRCEEPLRVKMISGVFNNVTMEQMLRGAFIYEANKVKVDGKPIIQVAEIDPPHNKAIFPNLIIPHGTLLRDLPGYLHENENGIYNAGIGNFFQRFKQKPTWFVYPLYAPKRFDEDRYKIVIYSVPPDKMAGYDKTYRREGKITYIAATGDRKEADHAKNPELNLGVGFRMPDAEAFMKKPVKILPDSWNAKRKNLNYEVSHRDRKDSLSYAPVIGSSANPFFEFSEVLSRQFTMMVISWENSDPELLYPGMPCKYVYMDRGIYTEAKGTLAVAYSITQLLGNPIEDRNFMTTTQMYLIMEPQSEPTKNDPNTIFGDER